MDINEEFNDRTLRLDLNKGNMISNVSVCFY